MLHVPESHLTSASSASADQFMRASECRHPHTNCLCILFLFLRVSPFYLFLLVHIVLIILHQQQAATWGWADLMSVRGRGRDRGAQAGVLSNHPKMVTARLVSKVTAGIWCLSRQLYLRNGAGGSGGGVKTGHMVSFLCCLWFFVSRLRSLSCVFLCSAKPAAFI